MKVFTDGGCIPNPGEGAWAVVIPNEGEINQYVGSESNTTNNRMELTAVIKALELTEGPVEIFTDSQYVKNGITIWSIRWMSNGWKSSTGRVKNQDLWKRLLELVENRDVTWGWVKGHAQNTYNNMADALVGMKINAK